MTPDAIFALTNPLALAGWLLLALSLFVPRIRATAWGITGLVLPALFAVVYVVLIPRGFAEAPDGGFGSIGAVRALFASDAALTAGWLHYLAFDLFVGTFIARAGLESRVPAPLLLPCLALTFLFGPAGLLLFLVLRFITVRVRARGGAVMSGAVASLLARQEHAHALRPAAPRAHAARAARATRRCTRDRRRERVGEAREVPVLDRPLLADDGVVLRLRCDPNGAAHRRCGWRWERS